MSTDKHASDAHVRAAFSNIRDGRYAQALDAFGAALAVMPTNSDALRGRAQCLFVLGRIEEAVGAYDALLAVSPDMDYMIGERFHAQIYCCDWRDYEERRLAIAAKVRQGLRADIPGAFLCHSDSPAEQRVCAQIYAQDMCTVEPAVPQPAARAPGPRIRVAYLSADFHSHATAHLTAGLFERHDRSRFETFALSFGPNDHSAVRKRLEKAFDRFIDVAAWSDQQIAAHLSGLKVDIAVDLKGHTLGARTRIFALRPAPVQVSFLAFPGTMGADFIDYLIADRHVIPAGESGHYTEQIIRLPGSYQVNEQRRPAAPTPTRREAGLSDAGFIFCCFNSTHKITPAIFDAWMRLLKSVPGSVLWLLQGPPAAARNLGREARRQGVDPRRLVFAPHVEPAAHWPRVSLADVFLDTYPHNAHTTASDALWAGVPVVTLAGSTFTSRVATSLLHAVGLGELSTDSPAAYAALAHRLATDPERLRQLKQRLARARTESTLFDSALYARRLEAAYTEIWARNQRGEPPSALTIEATGT